MLVVRQNYLTEIDSQNLIPRRSGVTPNENISTSNMNYCILILLIKRCLYIHHWLCTCSKRQLTLSKVQKFLSKTERNYMQRQATVNQFFFLNKISVSA